MSDQLSVDVDIDVAVVGLQEAERQCMDVAQRDRLATAWWRMRQEKEGWVADYPQRLREAFAVPTDAPTSSRTTLLSESAYLSLVEDDTVTESIESARLLQSLLPPLEQELKVLDALMSSLQGLATVQADMNPLRPAVFVRALREMMALDESDSQLRALWLRHCGKAIGHELKGLYARLTLAGFHRQDVAQGTIHHLPHDDAERLGGADADTGAMGQRDRERPPGHGRQRE